MLHTKFRENRPAGLEKEIFEGFLLGMSSGVRISKLSNHVTKAGSNFCIWTFELKIKIKRCQKMYNFM